jgi:hypothetical protein
MAEQEPAKVDEYFVADKDPEYVYKWCNSRERVMMQRVRQGYEIVDSPEDIPEAVRIAANLPPTQTSGGVRRRGDLVLMRIRKDVHARNVAGPINKARERHSASVEQMSQQQSENVTRQMRAAGYKETQLRSSFVFPTKDEPFKA